MIQHEETIVGIGALGGAYAFTALASRGSPDTKVGGVTQALYNKAQQGRLHGDPHWNQVEGALTAACSPSSPIVGGEDPARQLTASTRRIGAPSLVGW